MRRWLLDGLDAFEAAGGKRPLCLILRLRGPGLRSLGYLRARQTMLGALRRALYLLECPNQHRGCQQLANRISTFESRVWPRVRHYIEPPDRLDAIEQELFRAFKSGQTVPASQGRLYCVLVENSETNGN